MTLNWITQDISKQNRNIRIQKTILPDGELNPGLPRDRRGYLPLYYRGDMTVPLDL